MARELPEFAGAYVDSGYLNIYLTDLAAAERANSVVARELERQRRSMPVRYQQAKYSYEQLEDFARALEPLGEGHVYRQLSQQHNRLHVGVSSVEARDRLTAKIRRLGLPADAVVVELTAPATPLAVPPLAAAHGADASRAG